MLFSLFLALLLFVLGSTWIFVILFVLFGVVNLGLGLMSAGGLFTPKYAKVVAPNGVAWVLRSDGVLLGQPHGPVLVPWPQVRIDAARVGGLPAVRISGNGAEASYAEEYLSHPRGQIEQAARQLSTLR